MGRHTLKLVHLNVDGRYTKILDESLQIAVRKGAREWLKSIITNIPVWTGQAKGGFKFASGTNGFLGRYLNVAIPITPTHFKRGKTPESGGDKAIYSFTNGQHKYQFYFRSDVVQWTLNEFFFSEVGSQYLARPWGLRFEANDAFQRSMAASIKKLPKIQSYLVKVTDVAI